MGLNVQSVVRQMRASLPSELLPWFDGTAALLEQQVRTVALANEAELEERARRIRAALRRAGVPAQKSTATRVRGFHKITPGVSIAVGDETERAAHQRNEWHARRRRLGLPYSEKPRTLYPDRLIVTGAGNPEWDAILAASMAAEGMVEDKPAHWRMR